MSNFDIIVIGAGIAGVSIAAHLAEHKRVVVLEMEERGAYHTTGRSAASYEPNYGPPPILAFTRASADFLTAPPLGFTNASLLQKRPSLFFEAEGQEAATEKLLTQSTGLREISEQQAQDYLPVLRLGYAKRSFLDQSTADMDVDLIFGGYAKKFKAAGGTLVTNAEAQSLKYHNGRWAIKTPETIFTAPIIVNAAGAWGDVVAERAGVRTIGLTPKRRSIGLVAVTRYLGFNNWPLVTDVGETWYAKPQSGKLIVSSADATPVEPHDAFSDDFAIAEGVDRLMQATTMEPTRVEHAWGGLRTFASDGNPVMGFDPHMEGFFWLVGQGGYGIQSAPALSTTAAQWVMGKATPQVVLDHGLVEADVRPERFR